MDAQHWLRELRAELARRRLPRPYVERFVLELSDHVTDFMEDRMSTDAKDLHGVFDRLGAPGQVADSAAKEYRKGRFSRRHPVCAFCALPAIGLPVLWVIFLLLLIGGVAGLDWLLPEFRPWMQASQAGLIALFIVSWLWVFVVPAVFAAIYFDRLVRRANLSWRWLLAACVGLTLVSSLLVVHIVPSLGGESGTGRFLIGLGPWTGPTIYHSIQVFVPLAIGVWLTWRHAREYRSMAV